MAELTFKPGNGNTTRGTGINPNNNLPTLYYYDQPFESKADFKDWVDQGQPVNSEIHNVVYIEFQNKTTLLNTIQSLKELVDNWKE